MPSVVFVSYPVDPAYEVYKPLQKSGCKVVFGKPSWVNYRRYSEAEMIQNCRNVDAIISHPPIPLTRSVLESATKLVCIAQASVGFDNIDLEAASRLGVLVTNAPTDSDLVNVAEHAVAFILALAKKLKILPNLIQEGVPRSDERMGTMYLGKGATIGIIGLGRIGSRVATRLLPFGVRLITYDPYKSDQWAQSFGVKRVDFHTLLKESDFVTIHAPLTSETRRMISAKELALMKSTSYLVNTARGGIVDEDVLVDALKNRKIAGAGLDVLERELTPGNPLLQMDNLLLTPHVAGRNAESLKESAKAAVEDCLKMLNGIAPEHVVNAEAVARWRERLTKGQTSQRN